jgi:hypothetical protein
MTTFCFAFYESYLFTSAAYSSGSCRRNYPNSRRATAFYHDVYILRGFDNVDSETRFQKVDTSVRITRSAADPLNLKPQAARLEIRRHFFSNRVVEGGNLSELKNARTVHLSREHTESIELNWWKPPNRRWRPDPARGDYHKWRRDTS